MVSVEGVMLIKNSVKYARFYSLILVLTFQSAYAKSRSGNLSEQILSCTLATIDVSTDREVVRKNIDLNLHIERAGKGIIDVSLASSNKKRQVETYSILGGYKISQSSSYRVEGDNYGKLLEIVIDNRVEKHKKGEQVYSLYLYNKYSKTSHIGRGYCKKSKNELTRFTFKDSLLPPDNYSEARIYYYPKSELPKDFHEINFRDTKSLNYIIEKNAGTKVGSYDWTALFVKPEMYGYFGSACYSPRHLLVFFNGNKQPISYAEVCFECKRYMPSDLSSELNLIQFSELVESVGLPISPKDMNSKQFKREFQLALDEAKKHMKNN